MPAISSNITGCNEIIKDGYNGRLISSKSVMKLKNVMEELTVNPGIIKEMSRVSKQYVIERYEQINY